MILDVALGLVAGAWLITLLMVFLGCLFSKEFAAATVIAAIFAGTVMLL